MDKETAKMIMRETKAKKTTIYDRIKAMSVEEMAEFLESTNSQCAIKIGGEYIIRAKEYIKIWLESEVDTE